MAEAGSSTSSRPALGLLAIALAAAAWSIAAVVARRLFEAGVEPVELAEARAVIAGAGLSIVALRVPRPRAPVPPARLAALGLSIALVNVTYYGAIDRMPVAVAIVLQYTAPALVVVYAAVALRRRPSAPVLGALVAAVAGVVLASQLLTEDLEAVDLVGVALGLASAVLFATYTLLSESVVDAYGAVGAMARAFVVAAAFWVAWQIPFGWPAALFEPGNAAAVLFVGVVGTLLPFLLYVWGIGRVRAERATIAATLEPVLAALAAWVWLGQTLASVQLLGGLLVIGAVIMLNHPAQQPRASALSTERT